MRVGAFNPLLHRNFEEIPEIKQEDRSRVRGTGKIPRTFLRMPNLYYKNKLLEKANGFLKMDVKKVGDLISIEPKGAESEKLRKELFRSRRIHGWKKCRKATFKSEQTPLTDQSLTTLVSEGSLVQKFSFFLIGCHKITDKGAEILALEATRNRTHLHSLLLGFANCEKIGDEGVRAIGKEVSRNLPNLKNFKMKLPGCVKITDKGLISLGCGISRLTKLEELTLYFDMINRITPEGFLEFGRIVSSQLHDLKRLRLSCGSCNGITDDSIGQFALYLAKYQKKLQLLSLNISNCSELTDKAPELLGKALSGVSSLRHLVISFDNCKKITDKGAEAIAIHFASGLPKLRKLTLSFFDVNLTEEGCQKLNDILIAIPNVKIVANNNNNNSNMVFVTL